jgi:glycerol-3-phosphate dehydrogenase subunit C
MEKNKEGSLSAPTRDIVDWTSEKYIDEISVDAEMRRQFEVCHGCRRCFNLCDSFPTLFELIDSSPNESVNDLSKKDFESVTDKCTLCDMCFMTKCPYVPPHEFNIDFPHLMLRYRTLQNKKNKLPLIPKQLSKIDRNEKLARLSPSLTNWALNKKNKITRKPLEAITGVDATVELPKFEHVTFVNQSKKLEKKVNKNAPAFGRKAAIYSTCYVNYNSSKVGIAAEKVLNFNGVETKIIYPGCCGMPFLEQAQHAKVKKQSETVSKELCQLIDKGYDIITLTASCGLMLKYEWLLINPDNQNLKKLSKKTYDIDQYIVGIAKKEGLVEGLSCIDGGVTVHHACHARAQNMGNKALEMLNKLPQTKVDVVEKCAGHGGTFGVMRKTRKSAIKYGRATAKQIKNKKNKYMVSDCPLACKHLNEFLNEDANTEYISVHPIEVFAKSYNLT